MRQPCSEETKEKISQALKGRIVSEETRRKLAIALQGNKNHLGMPMSEEAKQKISAANLGYHHTEEAKRAIAVASSSRRHSEASIAKMSASKKGKYCREESPRWKGGRRIDSAGYVLIRIGDHYELEHQLVAEQKLGRSLLPDERVHHIDGDKQNNNPDNLMLLSPKDHIVYTQICSKCPLRKEIQLLKWQVRQLNSKLSVRPVKAEEDE